MERKPVVAISPFLVGLAVFTVAILLGVIFLRQSGFIISRNGASPAPGITASASASKQLYQSTMHPWIVQDHPGTCPICGMELVRMSAEDQAQWERNHPS